MSFKGRITQVFLIVTITVCQSQVRDDIKLSDSLDHNTNTAFKKTQKIIDSNLNLERAFNAYKKGDLGKTKYYLDESEKDGVVSSGFYLLLGQYFFDKNQFKYARRYWKRGAEQKGCSECSKKIDEVPNSIILVQDKYPYKTKQVNLVLSLPWINSFYLKPQNEGTKNNTGFWGLSVGAEYFYKPNAYLKFNGSTVIDFFVPVPAAVDIYGDHAQMTSTYLSVSNNFKSNRLNLGYGINFSRNCWAYHFSDTAGVTRREPIKKSSYSVGGISSAHFQISRLVLVGIIYRPTILRISPKTRFTYEHLFSLEFAFRLSIKK